MGSLVELHGCFPARAIWRPGPTQDYGEAVLCCVRNKVEKFATQEVGRPA